MNLVNNTNTEIFWSVTSSHQADCGTLGPHEKFYFPVPAGPTYDVTYTPAKPGYFQINAQGDQTVTIAMTATSAAVAENESAQPEAAAAS